MKHLKQGRKFHRKRDQRKALLKSLVTALIMHEKITTTEAKAKELRPYAEKMITKSRQPSLANNKYLAARLAEKPRKKLVAEIGPRYKDRPGGYTRLIKKGFREKDAAPMTIIELVK